MLEVTRREAPPQPLLNRLLMTGAEIEARLERSLEPIGLSLAKLGVLHQLVHSERSLPLGQLAERLMCVKSNVTQLIDRLEAEGLVQRVPDPDDGRSVLARITPAGRCAYETGYRAQQEAQIGLLEPLSQIDQSTLSSILDQLHAGSK
jgi:DNA-binding MarR family transcriptional regulator